MKKIDLISYLKILGGLLLTFPLVHGLFASDFGLLIGGLIATGIYIVQILIAIPLFNYLEYGVFWYWVNHKKQCNFKNIGVMATVHNIKIVSYYINYTEEQLKKILEDAIKDKEIKKGNTIKIDIERE